MSVSARNMKNFRINRQPIHQILVNPLIEMKKVMGALFFKPAAHYKSTMCVIPSGLPILPNLLRYETFAVADYECMSHALHLRQTRQSLNLNLNESETEK